MTLTTAQNYALRITDWLRPHCQLIQVAGSIRRQRPICNDVDLVVIPKIISKFDLLGEKIEDVNCCRDFVCNYVSVTPTAKFISGEHSNQVTIVQLPKCQLDLYWCTEATWATVMLCRTGSKEHNIWIAQRALERNLHWTPNQGIHTLPGHPEHPRALPCSTEPEIYAHLGLRYIEPVNRELPYLSKQIDSGL